jgi:GNAT superfamily N-acetyltransferase
MPLQLDHLRQALDQPNDSPEASRDEVRMAFEITVRSANPSDAASVAACVNAAFSLYIERIGKPPGAMLADYPSIIAAGQVWVAEIDTQIVGVLVQFETKDGFYVDTVAAHPIFQGKGVGRALLVFAEQEARRRGFRSIYLCTNVKMTENQVFYPKIGYVEYERKQDEGYDRVFYRKQL